MFNFRGGRKTAATYTRENLWNQVEIKNPIGIWTWVGIEPGPQKWKSRKEPLYQPDSPQTFIQTVTSDRYQAVKRFVKSIRCE